LYSRCDLLPKFLNIEFDIIVVGFGFIYLTHGDHGLLIKVFHGDCSCVVPWV
jgi:hypothetical protein